MNKINCNTCMQKTDDLLRLWFFVFVLAEMWYPMSIGANVFDDCLGVFGQKIWFFLNKSDCGFFIEFYWLWYNLRSDLIIFNDHIKCIIYNRKEEDKKIDSFRRFRLIIVTSTKFFFRKHLWLRFVVKCHPMLIYARTKQKCRRISEKKIRYHRLIYSFNWLWLFGKLLRLRVWHIHIHSYMIPESTDSITFNRNHCCFTACSYLNAVPYTRTQRLISLRTLYISPILPLLYSVLTQPHLWTSLLCQYTHSSNAPKSNSFIIIFFFIQLIFHTNKMC